MKRLIIFTSAFLFIFPFIFQTPARAEQQARPELNADAAVLIDADTGIVLFKKNMDKREYPASVTKIMTCLLALEHCAQDERVSFSHAAIEDIPYDSSHIAMNPGDTLSVRDALLGLMLASANEVANALAEHIGGTRENFIDMMNLRARELGANDTHFVNPSGLHGEQHYTTARDMALIMREAVKREDFLKIISTKSYEIPPTETQEDTRWVNNSNKLIWPDSPFYNEFVIGGKTGYTTDSLHTLVTYAQKDGINLISAALRTEKNYIYKDSTALFDYGFSLYRQARVFNADDFIASAEIIKDQSEPDKTEQMPLRAAGDVRGIYPSPISEYSVVYETELRENLSAPIKKGEELGILIIKYQEAAIAEVPLLAAENMEARNPPAPAVEAWAQNRQEPAEVPKDYISGFKFDFIATIFGGLLESLGRSEFEIFLACGIILLASAGITFACISIINGGKRRDREKFLLRSINKSRKKKAAL